ncbi:MAG: hypothetical protein HYY04_16580 [Chloroflexi bacterium]|nr:hypothetical protein [Chloroflexota bacterium]
MSARYNANCCPTRRASVERRIFVRVTSGIVVATIAHLAPVALLYS